MCPSDSPIDKHAAYETTSVYTGVETFPMLPEELSTDLTSLNEDVDRLAVVVEMVVGRDGSISSPGVYRALVRNQAQLTYNGVGRVAGRDRRAAAESSRVRRSGGATQAAGRGRADSRTTSVAGWAH